LFCGADFNSLEDYVSALTTKDPNKLDVYIKGFDGHCLRAGYYFKEQCPEIDLTDPVSVNSIKDKYPELRQESKAPTFLLTYGGTYHGLMNNLGWTHDKAINVEANYHTLYAVSDQYIASRITEASKVGYADVAFGLRVRTPLLHQCLWGSSYVPYEAQAQARTVGNAMGQSYGLLNNRAAIAFMRRVWASKYKTSIYPVALIHDAIYLVIKDDPDVIAFANSALIEEMQWQELPELQHPTVKLGAALDVFWPTWADKTTLPNYASVNMISVTMEGLRIKEGLSPNHD
jgi:DNA polymerase-1